MITFDHKPPVAHRGKVAEYNEMVAGYNEEVSDYNIVEKKKKKAGVEGGLFKEKKKMTVVDEDMVDMQKKTEEFGTELEKWTTFREEVYLKRMEEFNKTVDEYNSDIEKYNDTMEDAYKKKMMHKKARFI